MDEIYEGCDPNTTYTKDAETMPEPIRIPCTITITPGGATMQNKIRMEAGGETVFNDYEESLPDYARMAAKEIAKAHARLLKKWGET